METLDHSSTAVQHYLGLLQSIINRMASQSTGCKTWCITLVSAILVIIADKGHPEYIWLGCIPILLFFFLDSYYLGLERAFRTLSDNFVRKLHQKKIDESDLYQLKPYTNKGEIFYRTLRAAFCSFSTLPFYLLISVMLIAIRVAFF